MKNEHRDFFWDNTMADGSSSAQVENACFNFPRLLNSVNRTSKYTNVDNGGNAQLYHIGVKLLGGANAKLRISGAPNTYYVRRAIKAWHDARVKMYKRAGITMKSLGYGRQLRPYLNQDHETGSLSEITTTTDLSPNVQSDEWTYSRAVVTTPVEEGSNPSSTLAYGDLVDSYSFTILDASVAESTTADDPDGSTAHADQDSYVSVGMVDEWLDSFKRSGSVTASATRSIDPDNALLQLMSQQSADKEELLELAEETSKEGRPWDLDNSSGIYTELQPLAQVRATSSIGEYAEFLVPCGLFKATMTSYAAQEVISAQFTCLGVYDM